MSGSLRKIAPAKNATDHKTPYQKRSVAKPITSTRPATTVSHNAMHGNARATKGC